MWQLRRGLYGLAGILLCAAIAGLVGALILPVERRRPPRPLSPVVTHRARSRQSTAAPVLDLSGLADRRFQGPLFDPPPPPPPAAEPAPPPLPPPALKLVATMLEPGLQQAMLIDPQGKTWLKRCGERVTDGQSIAEIVEIRARSIVLRHQGQNVVIKASR